MITEFFITLGTTIGGWFFDWIPDLDSAETLVVDASNSLGPVLAGAGALGPWLPWDVLVGTFLIVISIYVAMFLAKIGLKVAGFIPFIGGTG